MPKRKKKHRGQSAAFMRSINPHLKHKRKVYKVHRRSFGMAKRRHSRKSRGFNLDFGLGISPAIYGYGYKNFVMNPVDNLVKNFTKNNLNLQVADNIARGALLILAKKFFKQPLVTSIANAGLAVEGAGLNLTATSTTSAQTLNTTDDYVLS